MWTTALQILQEACTILLLRVGKLGLSIKGFVMIERELKIYLQIGEKQLGVVWNLQPQLAFQVFKFKSYSLL